MTRRFRQYYCVRVQWAVDCIHRRVTIIPGYSVVSNSFAKWNENVRRTYDVRSVYRIGWIVNNSIKPREYLAVYANLSSFGSVKVCKNSPSIVLRTSHWDPPDMSRSRSKLVTLSNKYLTLSCKIAKQCRSCPNIEVMILNQNRKKFLKSVIYSLIE